MNTILRIQIEIGFIEQAVNLNIFEMYICMGVDTHTLTHIYISTTVLNYRNLMAIY